MPQHAMPPHHCIVVKFMKTQMSSLFSSADVPTRLIRLKEVCKVLGGSYRSGWMGKTLHCPLITSSTIPQYDNITMPEYSQYHNPVTTSSRILAAVITVIINVVSNSQFLQQLISLYTH